MARPNISIRNLRGQGDTIDSGGIEIGRRNNGAVVPGNRQPVGTRNSGGSVRAV